MNSSDKPTEQPFADDGGIKPRVVPDEDPYRTLDDLRVVVEALCPVWPPGTCS